MSPMRISGAGAPVVSEPVARPAAKPAAEEPRAPEKAQSREVRKENFISSLVSLRQPPQMPLSTMLSKGPTSVFAMFAKELDSFEGRSADDVAADLAETYIGYAGLAKSQNDGDLTQAFDELGEVMRGYEHLRMMRTGDLG